MSWSITPHSHPIYEEGSIVGREAKDFSKYRTYCDGDHRWFCKVTLHGRKPFIEGPFLTRIVAAKRAARHLYDNLVAEGWIK